MRLYRFDTEAGRDHARFGSVGLRLAPVTRIARDGQVMAMWIEPGGHIGAHPARGPQLFLVIHGAGWVEGGGARAPILAWQAAYWDDGEFHAAGSPGGMGALVIEGDQLDISLLHPLYPGDEGAPA